MAVLLHQDYGVHGAPQALPFKPVRSINAGTRRCGGKSGVHCACSGRGGMCWFEALRASCACWRGSRAQPATQRVWLLSGGCDRRQPITVHSIYMPCALGPSLGFEARHSLGHAAVFF